MPWRTWGISSRDTGKSGALRRTKCHGSTNAGSGGSASCRQATCPGGGHTLFTWVVGPPVRPLTRSSALLPQVRGTKAGRDQQRRGHFHQFPPRLVLWPACKMLHFGFWEILLIAQLASGRFSPRVFVQCRHPPRAHSQGNPALQLPPSSLQGAELHQPARRKDHHPNTQRPRTSCCFGPPRDGPERGLRSPALQHLKTGNHHRYPTPKQLYRLI